LILVKPVVAPLSAWLALASRNAGWRQRMKGLLEIQHMTAEESRHLISFSLPLMRRLYKPPMTVWLIDSYRIFRAKTARQSR